MHKHLQKIKDRFDVSELLHDNKTRIAYLITTIIGIPALILALMYHDDQILFTLGTFVLILIAVVVNTFVVVYLRRNWKANPYGRALMYSKISLAVLVDLSLITSLLGPDWEWRGFTRFILFSGILFAQARLLQLLFSVRNVNARDEYDKHHDSEGKEV